MTECDESGVRGSIRAENDEIFKFEKDSITRPVVRFGIRALRKGDEVRFGIWQRDGVQHVCDITLTKPAD